MGLGVALGACFGFGVGMASGGSFSSGLKGALGGALGGAAGGALAGAITGGTAGSFGGTAISNLLTGAGALHGADTFTKEPPKPISFGDNNGAPINIPSFEQLKQNAVAKTQEAFDREGIYHLLNPFRRFKREIAPADRGRFPSLAKTAKERAKKRNVMR